MNTAAPRVLLVDEVADDRAIYGTGLRFLGFEVAVAGNIPDALEQILEAPPDIIVLHLGTDHWHLCDALGEHRTTRGVPVIVITADVRPDRANRERARATPNCAAFLGKPCTHEDIAAVIRRVLGGERDIEVSSGALR